MKTTNQKININNAYIYSAGDVEHHGNRIAIGFANQMVKEAVLKRLQEIADSENMGVEFKNSIYESQTNPHVIYFSAAKNRLVGTFVNNSNLSLNLKSEKLAKAFYEILGLNSVNCELGSGTAAINFKLAKDPDPKHKTNITVTFKGSPIISKKNIDYLLRFELALQKFTKAIDDLSSKPFSDSTFTVEQLKSAKAYSEELKKLVKLNDPKTTEPEIHEIVFRLNTIANSSLFQETINFICRNDENFLNDLNNFKLALLNSISFSIPKLDEKSSATSTVTPSPPTAPTVEIDQRNPNNYTLLEPNKLSDIIGKDKAERAKNLINSQQSSSSTLKPNEKSNTTQTVAPSRPTTPPPTAHIINPSQASTTTAKIDQKNSDPNALDENKLGYKILLSEDAIKKWSAYKNKLEEFQKIPGEYVLDGGQETPGEFFRNALKEAGVKKIADISLEKFMDIMLATKEPTIFAETVIKKIAKGEDNRWNVNEVSLLGDVNVCMSVKCADNGAWGGGKIVKYKEPIDIELIFTPGALMQSGPDREEVVELDPTSGKPIVVQEKYNGLENRRLLPAFVYSNITSSATTPALVSMPGIGCGAFAGFDFDKVMATHLDIALQTMLQNNIGKFPDIKAIFFDPFDKLKNDQKNFDNVKYMVRPNRADGNGDKTQLAPVKSFEDKGDDFSKCKLFKIVAWDHLSLPGNDYHHNYIRATDDGMIGAATNVAAVLCKSKFDLQLKYVDGMGYMIDESKHPKYKGWDFQRLFREEKIHLRAAGNVKIVSNDGKYQSLDEYLSLSSPAISNPIQSSITTSITSPLPTTATTSTFTTTATSPTTSSTTSIINLNNSIIGTASSSFLSNSTLQDDSAISKLVNSIQKLFSALFTSHSSQAMQTPYLLIKHHPNEKDLTKEPSVCFSFSTKGDALKFANYIGLQYKIVSLKDPNQVKTPVIYKNPPSFDILLSKEQFEDLCQKIGITDCKFDELKQNKDNLLKDQEMAAKKANKAQTI